MDAILEWRILAWRFALGVGALCGLVSLLNDAPGWVACLRAGGACFLIAALARFGERALGSSPDLDPVEEPVEDLSGSPGVSSIGARANSAASKS
jgi:hypothetical protein